LAHGSLRLESIASFPVLFETDGDRLAEAGHSTDNAAAAFRLALSIGQSSSVKAPADDSLVSVHRGVNEAAPRISRAPSTAKAPVLFDHWKMLIVLMDEAEADVLAYMNVPAQHRAKLHSTNPLERLKGEITRRSDVVGIFPNEDAVVRLIGALLLEQNDEWAVQRARDMTLETIAPLGDNLVVSLPPLAA
jgi:Transposase, Mutator family